MSTVEAFLERLEGVKPGGPSQWTARCPAHEDRSPSLSVGTGGDGRVLLTCHAGCTPAAICDALGITMADLFPRRPGAGTAGGRQQQQAVHNYCDENGVLLWQVVRRRGNDGGKKLTQRRPDGNGGWINGVRGVRRVLYRLPDLLEADPSRAVFVAEGETCCDALAAAGLVTTTNPGGAGKWRDEYAHVLQDRRVVVLPDNDAAGRVHAARVADSLRGVAAQVVVLDLPGLAGDGADVVDWFGAGGTVEKLTVLAERALGSVTVETVETVESVETGDSKNVRKERICAGQTAQHQGSSTGPSTDPGAPFAQTVREGYERQRAGEEAREKGTGRPYLSPLFLLVHSIRWHPQVKDSTPAEAMAATEAVLTTWAARDGAAPDPWLDLFGLPRPEAEIEFDYCWAEARFPPGHDPLPAALARADAEPVHFPTESQRAVHQRVLNVAHQLQADRPGADIALCQEALGKLLGVGKMAVSRCIAVAAREGYLIPRTKHQWRPEGGGRCRRYRFHNPPVPKPGDRPTSPAAPRPEPPTAEPAG